MDDSELTSEHIALLKQQLLTLKDELEYSIQSGNTGAKPVTLDQPSVGRLSRMDAMQQQSMAQATTRQLKQRLELVKNALRSLDSEDFGSCKSCGEAIGLARLQVRPEAPFCISCQSAREL